MPFPKNKRTTFIMFLIGVAIFISLFYIFPAASPFGTALRSKSVGFFAFVAAFGLAVFIHELGHFLAAKAFKVPVERFVIGFDRDAMPFMPRCIWEKKIGETTYGLSLMPLGGYVKMLGTVHPDIEEYLEGKEKKGEAKSEEAEETPESAVNENTLTGQAILDQAALYKKPFYQKVIIYSAGVIMNLLLAMALLVFLSVKGVTVPAPTPAIVAWQEPGSLLLQQDIRQGDVITEFGVEASDTQGTVLASIGKKPVITNKEMNSQLEELQQTLEKLEINPKKVDLVFTAVLTLQRGEETIERTFSTPDGNKPEELPMVIDYYQLVSRPAYIGLVQPDSPAERGKLKRGDMVLSIKGEPIDDWLELLSIIQNSLGEKLEIVVRRNGEIMTTHVTPYESDQVKGRGQIGVKSGSPEIVVKKIPFGKAVVSAPGMVWDNMVHYVQQLGSIGKKLIHGEIGMVRRQLGGPVAIARMASFSANVSFELYVSFLIMFNIALAIINILPIPILDGGHIVLAAFELVFRRPVPPKVLIPVLNGAFVVLITLFLLITFSDLSKWIFRV